MRALIVILATAVLMFVASTAASLSMRPGPTRIMAAESHEPAAPWPAESGRSAYGPEGAFGPSVRDDAAGFGPPSGSRFGGEAPSFVREELMQLVYEDLREERAAMEALRFQIEDETRSALAQVGGQARDVRPAGAEIGTSANAQSAVRGDVRGTSGQAADRPGVTPRSAVRIPHDGPAGAPAGGSVYDTMAPDNVAAIILQLSASGHLEGAVALLELMQERQAAKVLAALAAHDAGTAGRLTARLQKNRSR